MTEEAYKVDEEIRELIKPYYEKYKDTMCLKELTSLIIDVVTILEAEMILIRNMEIRKKQKEECKAKLTK
jgi:cobalamin biosynthesis Mg chelatase CobN